ncbi:hypothetical protein M2T79_15900 [Elizabethkingia miricola]|uniref:hypothetical protein n=1 Tax=Elizabethkingia miricola TaxID=172045 RepID=UPI0020186328|nr:hypothetical protein [Elizabethkingia miricola]MCL1658087.1 hypothetical protein [Elizabethkingia miricola]
MTNNTLLKELKALKAKFKSHCIEGQNILQRIEFLEEKAQEKNGVEAVDKVQLAVLKAAQRRGYSKIPKP